MTEEEKLLSEITGEIVTSPDGKVAPKSVKVWQAGVTEDQLGSNYRPTTVSAMDRLKRENQDRLAKDVAKREERHQLVKGPEY